MAWSIQFSRQADKQFGKLDRQTQEAIVRYLRKIITNGDPRSLGKSLTGTLSGLWRYRIGKYRILCDIQDSILVVEIITIDKRDKV